jgi:hypothetical protein
MYPRREYGFVAALFGLAGLTLGCGGTESPSACAPENEIHSVCAGVPKDALCSSDVCTDGVSCADIVKVDNDSSLASALAGASPGTCIALSPGTYKAADLPGGVSLLGRSASDVQVGSVTLGAGVGATLRGLTVGAEGLTIAGATKARVESVRVSGAVDLGVLVTAGSSVTIVTSSFEGSGRYNLEIGDGAAVELDRAIISGSDGPGVWAACSTDCGCVEKPSLTMSNSIVRDNHLAGIVLFGATASFEGVDILSTLQGDKLYFGQGGGGLSIARCSSVTATRLRVERSDSFGVLVDGASAALGSEGSEGGVELRGNVIGLWVSNVLATQMVSLVGATIEENQGVGVGVSGETRGFIVCKSHIKATQSHTLPVYEGGTMGFVKEVGDGLVWLDSSEAIVTDLTLSANARASIVINGEASGNLQNITLQGGDEAKGILHQSFAGGSKPTIGAGVPALSTHVEEVFAVPVAPPPPARNL